MRSQRKKRAKERRRLSHTSRRGRIEEKHPKTPSRSVPKRGRSPEQLLKPKHHQATLQHPYTIPNSSLLLLIPHPATGACPPQSSSSLPLALLLLLVILAGVPPPFSFALLTPVDFFGGVAGETPILIASANDSFSRSTACPAAGVAGLNAATPFAASFFLGVAEDLAGVAEDFLVGDEVLGVAEAFLASRSA
jgi:hypothetical protein